MIFPSGKYKHTNISVELYLFNIQPNQLSELSEAFWNLHQQVVEEIQAFQVGQFLKGFWQLCNLKYIFV